MSTLFSQFLIILAVCMTGIVLISVCYAFLSVLGDGTYDIPEQLYETTNNPMQN